MGKTIRNTPSDYVKANRNGSRQAELEFQTGFVCKHKVHKSAKDYARKGRYMFMEF